VAPVERSERDSTELVDVRPTIPMSLRPPIRLEKGQRRSHDLDRSRGLWGNDAVKRYLIWGIEALAWFAALDAVLQLQRLPDHVFGPHSVCGPWGCGAPLPALLACHGFWAILLAPPTVLAVHYLPTKLARRLGVGLIAAAVSAMVAIAAWEAAHWLPQVLPSQRHFFVERCLFSLVTLTDAPIMQVLVAGLCLCFARRRAAASTGPQPPLLTEGGTSSVA
jgi:hypothetical protein